MKMYYHVWKIGKEIITFGDTEIEKTKCNHDKTLILFKDLDIDNIKVYSMVSSGGKVYKNFISYKKDHNYKIKPLRQMLPKTSAFVKTFDGKTKWMYWQLDIWIKVSNNIKKNLTAKPSTSKNLKTKKGYYGSKATNFHSKKKYLKHALCIFVSR